MSRGVNKVILVCTIGKDPEIRYLPSGGAVASVSGATSEKWKDKQTGQEQESTEWHRIVFFNRLAEVVRDYVKKGSKIYVDGKLKTRSWEQDGVTKYATEIVANDMQLLDSRNSGPAAVQSNDAPARPQQPARQPLNQPPADYDDFDDDLPPF
jgi:single-strand DNA-binding protein